jgi:hypothetical protein
MAPCRRNSRIAATPERAIPTTTTLVPSNFRIADYRSFNVVSANSAITNPAIQNLVMIFDSSHPSASK